MQKAFVSFFINVIVKPYNFIIQTKLFLTNKGKIKARRKGTTKITITTKSGKKITCTVKVSAKKKTSKKNTKNVYWVPNGSVYHSTSDCPTLSRSRTIYSGSKSKCPKARACKVCH